MGSSDLDDDGRHQGNAAPGHPIAARRIILHPKTASARRQDRARTFGSHVRGYTVDTDEVLDLLASQRKLSIRLFLVIFGPVATLPLVFRFAPKVANWTPFGGAPFAWLALGPIVLFTIVLVAIWHERRALGIEERWSQAKDGTRNNRPGDDR